jgi:methionyl-tRNA formyltransferase
VAKVVFMGTPDFAVPTLQALIENHEVIGVVTQPDRPAGRGGEMRPSPIKVLAQQNNIPVLQPEKLRQILNELRAWQADVFIVAAFGQLLPPSVLDMPPHGCVNVHGSLLPRWRGAAPIHAAIRAGDSETGITIMRMDVGLDTGPMLSKRAIEILPTDTAQTLHDKMAQVGADLLIETLPGYLNGEIKPETQDESLVTYAPQIEKHEGAIDWTLSAESIERLVRAFTPWPGTYTFWNGKQVKIHSGVISGDVREDVAPGQVIWHNNTLAIGTGHGLYVPTELQLEGKKRVAATDFVRGYAEFVGATLIRG